MVLSKGKSFLPGTAHITRGNTEMTSTKFSKLIWTPPFATSHDLNLMPVFESTPSSAEVM